MHKPQILIYLFPVCCSNVYNSKIILSVIKQYVRHTRRSTPTSYITLSNGLVQRPSHFLHIVTSKIDAFLMPCNSLFYVSTYQSSVNDDTTACVYLVRSSVELNHIPRNCAFSSGNTQKSMGRGQGCMVGALRPQTPTD